MKSTIAACVIAIMLVLCGCDDEGPQAPENEAPIPCFAMSVVHQENADCAYQLEFLLDPACTTDDETITADLEVRWDYDNDGFWDTDFSNFGVFRIYGIDPLATMWTARLQVRDLDGNVATLTDSIPVGPFPTEPDLIAGSICILTYDSWDACEDTVSVGEEFSIMAYKTCYGDFSSPMSRAVITLDGEIFFQQTGGCHGGLFGCGGGGYGGFEINTPGVYELVLYVDYDDVYAETDETNNTVGMTLTVIP